MRILSFDTSTVNLYACLAEGESIVADKILVCNPHDRQFAASSIMPALVDLFHQAGWQKQDLQLIVVGVGPGGFTGTRIAVVTARTLAQALNLPLLGINRFECYAYAMEEDVKRFPSAMILFAGKKQYFCAHLKGDIFSESIDSYWHMNSHHIAEDNLFVHLQDFEYVYMEKSAAHQIEDVLGSTTNNWQLLGELTNPAVTQATLANHKIQAFQKQTNPICQIDIETFLLKQFPYGQIKPLYIRNASVTVKSSPALAS